MNNIVLLGCCLLCLSGTRVQSKPQITKLFPVQELVDYHQQASNEVKPLDKFLGKLRATYNFVFRKPENTSNIEKILARDAPNPDVEKLKQIWSSQTQRTLETESEGDRTKVKLFKDNKIITITGSNWINEIRPLAMLELQDEDESEDTDKEVESVNPETGLQLPTTLSRQLAEWLGYLLGLTYEICSKLAPAVHNDKQ